MFGLLFGVFFVSCSLAAPTLEHGYRSRAQDLINRIHVRDDGPRAEDLVILAELAKTEDKTLQSRGFFSDQVHKLQNATVSGVASTIAQTVSDPSLTLARVEVVKGLSDTQDALNTVISQANSTGNTQVATLGGSAQAGAASAATAVNNIGQSLISGQKASADDQKTVALGIKAAQDAVQCMSGAITTPDQNLSNNVADATTAIGGLREGGISVVTSEGRNLTDLGLPDDFLTAAPDCTGILAAA